MAESGRLRLYALLMGSVAVLLPLHLLDSKRRPILAPSRRAEDVHETAFPSLRLLHIIPDVHILMREYGHRIV